MTVAEVGMVLLCLAGVSDDSVMFAALSSLADSSPTAPVDSDLWLDAQERDYLIALHYLTHVAHVLVLCHDGPALDLAAMRALRSVQLLRNANRAAIDEFMRSRESAFGTIAVNSYLPGFITPVLLAMFALGDDDVADYGMPEGVIFLRSELSRQVRQVARTLDLLNSVSPVVSVNSTICALLVRSDSTFGVLHGQNTTDPLSVEALMHDDDYVAPRSFVGDVLTAAVVRDVLSAQMPPPRIPKSKAKSRLWRFVDSYLPMSRQWFVAAATLQSLLLGDSGAKMVELASIRSPERTLSRSICTNALDAALNVYRQEPLPPLYGTSVHEARLKAATAEFDRLALGCCLTEFAGRLRNDCNALWTGGRQRCEVRSLTDRQCTLALNHAAAHQSDAALLVACSCGSTQRERSDLFSVDDAAAFYDSIGCTVCAASSTALVPLRNNAWRATVIGDYTANGAVQVKQPRFDVERNVLDKDLFSPISPLPKLLDDLLNDKPVPASSAPAGVADLARLVAQAQEQTRALLPTAAAAAVAAAASSGTATSSERSPVAVDATAHHRLDVVVRKLSAAIETSCVHGGVGYEFECEQGHRFFEPLDCSTALRACVSASSSRERPLVMACPRCKLQTAAQLRRIYVATSARGAQCVFHARVRTESENADEWHDSGAEVVLPAGKLIVLRLPVRAAIKLGDNSMRLMPNAVRLATTSSTAAREE